MVQNYACRCLNIKLHGEPSPEQLSDGFSRVHLIDDGIQVSLTHFTIRSRKYVGEGDKRVRYINVTCLLCQTVAYRVQMDDPNGDGPEGPLLSTSTEWRETQPLNSKDNWLEISGDCLSGNEYDRAFKSNTFSSAFSLLLPSPVQNTTPSPVIPDPLVFKIPSLAASLPPLFLAPPFTPSHPVFQTFSRHATKASDEIRKHVEEEIEAFIHQKLGELGEAEAKLKKDVDCLWGNWRKSWQGLTKEEKAPEVGRKASGSVPRISDFNPSPPAAVATSVPRRSSSRSPPSAHNTSFSLLSASLAQTSSIHQHMQSNAARSHSASPSVPTDIDLDRIGSLPKDTIVKGPYKRGTDDSFAVAASYKLSVADEESLAARAAVARAKQLEKAAKQAEDDAAARDRGRSGANSRRVQFAEALEEEENSTQEDTEGEPEVFDFDPVNEDRIAGETSVTPTASPKIKSSAPLPNMASSANDAENATPAEQQLMSLVGADLPSHRQGWKKDRKTWNVFADSSNAGPGRRSPGATDDDESTSDLSSEKSWKNPSAAAQSLPVTIGLLTQYKPSGADNRQPKSSLVDQPGAPVPPLTRRPSSGSARRVSASEATRERIYAARDISRSMDPGLSMDVDAIEEDDEDLDQALEESQAAGLPRETSEPPADRSHKQALLILQKSAAPDAAMWRSLAE